MGVDTIFYDTDVSLFVQKAGKDIDKKIQKYYEKLCKEYYKNYDHDVITTDWFVDGIKKESINFDEDDEIIIKVDSTVHRGHYTTFIPNLLLLLTAAKHYNTIPQSQTLSYRTEGDSGVFFI